MPSRCLGLAARRITSVAQAIYIFRYLPLPHSFQSRPTLHWIVTSFMLASFAVLPIHFASGQDANQDVTDLKARLTIMEKRMDQLIQQNQQLSKTIAELPSAPSQKTSETKAKQPASQAQGESEKAKTSQKDKTEEKDFVVGTNLKMEGAWKNGLWFTSPDKAFKFNVGGVIQYDMGFFNAGDNVKRSLGISQNLVDPGYSLEDSSSFRRARLRFAGTLYEQFEFYAQYDFAQALDLRRRTLGISPAPKTPPTTDFDPGDDVGFNEVWFGLNQIPVLGEIRIGRHRESLNFITATSDTNQVWMERGLMFDAFNGDFNFTNGILVQNTYFDQHAYSCFGFYHSNNNTNRGFFSVGDGEYAYDARLTFMPLDDEDEQLWAHLGADYSYRVPHMNQLRYRARPMVRSGTLFETPNVVNTGTIFTNDGQQIANLESAMAWGRFTFAAEYAMSWVNDAYTGGLPLANGKLPAGVVSRGNYLANGGYVEALCFLTPDHRTYRKERPGYDRVVPNRTFYFMDTDKGHIFSTGAWEVGIRYDHLELSDNGLNGGNSNAVTGCVNWYLNPNARVQLNYFWMNRSFSPPDSTTVGAFVNGDIRGLGIRFNCDF